jgi:acetoin:2,6-dichlorophenolindophenol oxidoreductase subunit alpha
MVHIITMPDLGQTVSEGKILRWLKKPGDRVSRGEYLLEVETDKVTMEVESYVSGYLRAILVEVGQMGGALSPIAIVTDGSEEPFKSPVAGTDNWHPPAGASASTPDKASPASRKVLAAPAAMSAARELAIDLEAVAGTGPEGLITRRDVEHFAGVHSVQQADPTRDSGAPEHAIIHRQFTRDQKLAFYRRMLLCRMFEDRIYYLFLEGRLPGTVHQSQGQEASAVGVCSVLEKGDVITSTHRPHSHAIARGLSVESLMAELLAKKTGCCQGKGGSMHVGDLAAGMLPAIAIVGGGIPIAVGLALAFQILNKKNIVACFFGDGAANIGTFHEGINMAAIWNLPVVFVCENNKYGASTSVTKVMKVKHVSERAAAYGIPGETVDGNDVEAVYCAMSRAAQRAREGSGPTLLELETYRFAGHSRSDPGHYRSKEEVAAWRERDPITVYENQLLEQGHVSATEINQIKADIDRILDEAIRFAENSPSPLPEDCLNDVFA